MKSLVPVVVATAITAVLLSLSPTAAADHYRGDRHHKSHQPLELAMKARVNGSHPIRLRQLIESRYRIDTSRYRLRSVTVANKARYPASANLRVGRHATGHVDLHRGVTHIRAPQGRSRGAWVLDVDAARVRWVSVVLEPVRGSYERRVAQHQNRVYDYKRRAHRRYHSYR